MLSVTQNESRVDYMWIFCTSILTDVTSPPSCAECHEIWEPKPPGTLWATPGLLRDSFTFTFIVTDVKLLLLALQQVIMIII